MKPPVLVIAFRRDDLVEPLIERIKTYKPSRIYLACDGARVDQVGEQELVEKTRNLLRNLIDWECEIYERFQTTNLGLADHVVSAIDWVFEREDRVIVLEDDCFPHPDFFTYCEQLLERYLHDSRVWCILGDNSGKTPLQGNASYGFVKYSLPVWGIAIWKRAWVHLDRNLDIWEDIRKTPRTRQMWRVRRERKLMQKMLDRVKYVTRHGWAYTFMFSMQYYGATAILPRVNLVTNVGHSRQDAVHTKGRSLRANFPVQAILPLTHPERVARDKRAETFAREGRLFGLKKTRLSYRLAKRVRKFFRAAIRWLRQLSIEA